MKVYESTNYYIHYSTYNNKYHLIDKGNETSPIYSFYDLERAERMVKDLEQTPTHNNI